MDRRPGHPGRQPLQLVPDPALRRHAAGRPGRWTRPPRPACSGSTRPATTPSGTGAGRRARPARSSRSPRGGHAPALQPRVDVAGGHAGAWPWSTWTPRGRGRRCSAARPPGPLNAVTTPLHRRRRPRTAWSCARRRGRPRTLDLFSQTVGFGAAAVPEGSIPTPGDAARRADRGRGEVDRHVARALLLAGAGRGGRASPTSSARPTSPPTPSGPARRARRPRRRTSPGPPCCCASGGWPRGCRPAPADLRAALEAGALDLGAPGPDPLYGAGMARLDSPRRAWRCASGRARARVVRVRAVDAGTIRQVQVTLNGRRLRAVRRPVVGRAPPALGRRGDA